MSIDINQVFINQSCHFDDFENNRTTIRIASDGLSVFVSNDSNNVYFASSYRWAQSSQKSMIEILNQVKEQDPWLVNLNSKLTVLLDDDGFIHIPNELFDEQNLHTYLQDQVDIDKFAEGQLFYNTQKNITGVFIINKKLVQEVKEVFKDAEITSYSNALLKFSDSIKHVGKSCTVLLSINNFYFDMVVKKRGQLYFFNRFQFTTKEDFIYFIIMTLQKLEIISSDVEIAIIGKIESQSSLNELIRRYFEDVRFAIPEKECSWDYHRYCVEQNY
ncbi:MAG: DUF3822 family protein [Bacteroidota bacterium]